MKNNKNEYIAVCGLDCGSCDAFIATQADDGELREKTAKEWTERYRNDGRDRPPVRTEDINCGGCLSDGPIYLYCLRCKVRQCGLGRGIKNCKECEEYRCGKLVKLQSHRLLRF